MVYFPTAGLQSSRYKPLLYPEEQGAGLKVQHFQNRTEPIRLFNISNFPSIVKDELAILQQQTAVKLPAETRITFTFCCKQ